MNNKEPDTTRNLLGRLVGWEGDTGGRVELLADCGHLKIGDRVNAHIREVAMGRQPVAFDHLKKMGLRTGGLVLLRKIADEGNGTVSAKSVETILGRESYGLPYVIHNAAINILPPPEGTAMVSECTVALAADACRTHSVSEGLVKITRSIEEACQFGPAGIILTGEGKDGDVREVIVGGETPLSADEVTSAFLASCPKEIIQMVRKSKEPWLMTAFFRGEVDPDRASKFSAQRANYDFGQDDELSWANVNVVLRSYADSWLVCDATSPEERVGDVPGLLLDVI